MEHKTQEAQVLTLEDKKRMIRGARGLHFQLWRKQAGLTLRQVTDVLAKEGIKLPFAMLSLFERGGMDRNGNFVARARRQMIDFRPELLSRLEDLYNVPLDKRLEHRGSYAQILEATAMQSVMQPILGQHPLSDAAKLRVENSLLQAQLDREKKINETLMQTIESLQSLIRKPLLGTQPKTGWVPPEGDSGNPPKRMHAPSVKRFLGRKG